jgi:hypothetical protein
MKLVQKGFILGFLGTFVFGVTIPREQVVYVGRVDSSDANWVRFDWSAIEISTSFSGTSISVNLIDYGNEYNVFIDDNFYGVFNTTNGVFQV